MTEQEFSAAVEAVRPRLVRAAAVLVRGYDEPEDVVQQALAECYANLDKYDGTVQLSTWVTSTVKRRAIDSVRNAKNKLRLESGGASEFDDLEEQSNGLRRAQKKLGESGESGYVRDYEMMTDVKLALESLPPDQMAIVLAVCIEGYSVREYAFMASMSETAARANLDKAKSSLREHLAEYGPELQKLSMVA